MPGAIEFQSKRQGLLLAHPKPSWENVGFFLRLSPDKYPEIHQRFGKENILVQIGANENNDTLVLSCGSYLPGFNSFSSHDYKQGTRFFEFYHLRPVPLSFYPYLMQMLSRNNYYLQNTTEEREIIRNQYEDAIITPINVQEYNRCPDLSLLI